MSRPSRRRSAAKLRPAASQDTLWEIKGTRYEFVQAGKPPIPITVAPRPSSARLEFHPSLRRTASQESSEPNISLNSSLNDARSDAHGIPTLRPNKLRYDPRRDSAVAVSDPTARNSRATVTTTDESSTRSVRKSQSLPRMSVVNGGNTVAMASPVGKRGLRMVSSPTVPKASASGTASIASEDAPQLPTTSFLELPVDVPSISFEDLASPDNIRFSKRGSMLIGGKKANDIREHNASRPTFRNTASVVVSAPVRPLSEEEEAISQRVRSMYDSGSEDISAQQPHSLHATASQVSVEDFDAIKEEEPSAMDEAATESAPTAVTEQPITNNTTSDTTYLNVPSSAVPTSQRISRASFTRQEHELAGGIEDWQDVKGGDVDRYGFINAKAAPPSPLNNTSSVSLPPASPSPNHLHRVSTALQLASEAPRRNTSRLGRSNSHSKSTRSARDLRSSNTAHSKRPVSSQSSYRSTASTSSRLRSATNRLPHNRSRRLRDEAGDMLTLPPGLADIAEAEDGGRTIDSAKHKEWEREAKWRKMARLSPGSSHHRYGGGMVFDFDTRDPKLIERTWKGIPDRWRASAWYSFLAASAKRHPGSPTDAELRSAFDELVDQSSPDDGQIDTDVPRTIGSHIMFRKRYRGGQRLLFRVLHCLSLYFPKTGYVQGMAALAATFLCYFDEQAAFVMLVRTWQLRGLETLYRSGFDGLMLALSDFERKFLKGGLVQKKLAELGIAPTAYGTRWYLTLFNYSIPFPAQLRVWDVFLLLGDRGGSGMIAAPITAVPVSAAGGGAVKGVTSTTAANNDNDEPAPDFGASLDVLHATSAALIDATRDILLDSDFENAMKVLTSWIPIRDEDLLMRVAKAEWRAHGRRR